MLQTCLFAYVMSFFRTHIFSNQFWHVARVSRPASHWSFSRKYRASAWRAWSCRRSSFHDHGTDDANAKIYHAQRSKDFTYESRVSHGSFWYPKNFRVPLLAYQSFDVLPDWVCPSLAFTVPTPPLHWPTSAYHNITSPRYRRRQNLAGTIVTPFVF